MKTGAEVGTDWEYYFFLWLLGRTSPLGLLRHAATNRLLRCQVNVYTDIVDLLSCIRNANGFRMLVTSHSNHGKMPGHHFHPRRNVETVQPIEVKYPLTHCRLNEVEREKDDIHDAWPFLNWAAREAVWRLADTDLVLPERPRGKTGDHNKPSRYVTKASLRHITMERQCLCWWMTARPCIHPLLDIINCSS